MTSVTAVGIGPANGPSVGAGDEGRLEVAEMAAERARAHGLREDDDLCRSVLALSQLATGTMELTEVLTRVAEYAVAAIPGADGAGLTLLEQGRADTIVASAPFVADVDAIQYGLEEGPCITATLQGRTVRSGALSGDSRWPRFGPRVARLGVNSALALPLLTPDRVVGAMNIYAHDEDAYSDHAAQIGELFAVRAAIVVLNALVLAQARRLAHQLQNALTSRAVIDQALGILMSRAGSTAEEAFDQLRHRSQVDNVKLREVAHRVVEEAVRRARARRTSPQPTE